MGVFKPRIVSGGQTGADIAALRFALHHGFSHGGWCPRGRKSEAGPIPASFGLKETPSTRYVQRTEWNVRDSDGTVIFTIAPELRGGCKLTAVFARRYGKPVLHLVEKSGDRKPAEALRTFVQANAIRVLNVAGPRASDEPAVGRFVSRVLMDALGRSSRRNIRRKKQPHSGSAKRDRQLSRTRQRETARTPKRGHIQGRGFS